MIDLKSILIRILLILIGLYVVICVCLYFLQEKLIFFPERLPKDHAFSFPRSFEELNIVTKNKNVLNGLLFTSINSRGLIFYLHGNAGSLNSWGEVAQRYTALNYDVFILDYPGYGKSTGSIRGESQLFEDIRTAYDMMRKRYDESRIVILGYSIGTGPAAQLASTTDARLLILQAPYYNLTDLMKHRFPLVPSFVLKYKFKTNEYLKDCSMPVVIFHGKQHEVIYYGSSLKLEKEMKPGDRLITLDAQGHNGITDNSNYLSAIRTILP